MRDRRAVDDAGARPRLRGVGRGYQKLLRTYFSFLVPPSLRVLELGCGLADLLAAVRPAHGVGVDWDPAMLELARQGHPELEFHQADAATFRSDDKFDYVIVSDLLNDLPDVQALFENVHRSVFQHSRLVLNFHNNLWRPVLALAESLGLRAPTPPQNWLSLTDVIGLLDLAG